MYALTGANGQLGRLVLHHLLDLVPANHVIALTRTPQDREHYSSRGVITRRADFDDPASLETAFAGVTHLLIISTDAIGQRVRQHQAAISAAVTAGVRHLVYTSCPDAGRQTDPSNPLPYEHGLTEAALAASGISWIALRNHCYTEVLPALLNLLRVDETLLIPTNQAHLAWVMREDCARTAAFALAGKTPFAGPIVVAGPEKLNLTEIVHRWSSLSGSTIGTHELSPQKVIEQLRAKGVPEVIARRMVAIATWSIFEPSGNAVEQATGIRASSPDAVLRSLSFTS